MSVSALLNPRSIALVGASPRPGSLAERPLVNLRRHGFAGRILPINPRYEEVGGLKCYSSLVALDEAPDVVLVLTGIDQIMPTLDQAAAVGAKSAVLFAGGFAETGVEGAAAQAKLADYAAKGLRICGPNTNGLFNVTAGVAMGFSAGFELPARKGRVALISQSGAIATGTSSRGAELGVGFSHIVATGNEADLEAADFVEALIDDADVATFALYVEGLKAPARFLKVAERALAAGKPITMLLAGRSAVGAEVALSHTGAMAGSHDILVGALRQRGVAVVTELDDLIGRAAMFGTGRRAAAGALAVTSLSGGMAALIADECDAAGLPLATFAGPTREALGRMLPTYANLANPLDVTGQAVNKPELWTDCLAAVGADPGVDVVLNILSITANLTETRFCADIVREGAGVGADGPAQACLWTSGAPAGAGIDVLREAGVPVFFRADGAIGAIGAWRHYWETREARLAALAAGREAAAAIEPTGAVAGGWAILEAAGVPIARQVLATTRDDLAAALADFRFPVVVKVESAAIAHKTDLGLVRLGVTSADEALAAFDTMTATVAERLPGTAIDGVLVQEMIRGKRELILGIRQDAKEQKGGLPPAVALGMGGIFSETMADIAIRLAPLTAFDVEEMIGDLRMRGIFAGVRGLGPVDRTVFADLVVRFSHLALRHAGRVAELEVNPLILSDDGATATAVDVLVAPR